MSCTSAARSANLGGLPAPSPRAPARRPRRRSGHAWRLAHAVIVLVGALRRRSVRAALASSFQERRTSGGSASRGSLGLGVTPASRRFHEPVDQLDVTGAAERRQAGVARDFPARLERLEQRVEAGARRSPSARSRSSITSRSRTSPSARRASGAPRAATPPNLVERAGGRCVGRSAGAASRPASGGAARPPRGACAGRSAHPPDTACNRRPDRVAGRVGRREPVGTAEVGRRLRALAERPHELRHLSGRRRRRSRRARAAIRSSPSRSSRGPRSRARESAPTTRPRCSTETRSSTSSATSSPSGSRRRPAPPPRAQPGDRSERCATHERATRSAPAGPPRRAVEVELLATVRVPSPRQLEGPARVGHPRPSGGAA